MHIHLCPILVKYAIDCNNLYLFRLAMGQFVSQHLLIFTHCYQIKAWAGDLVMGERKAS